MAVTTAGTRSARAEATTHAVEIIGVGKSFGPVRALDHVDLHLDDGEFLAVLGPSGCGKTTLLRCLAGFERIDEGRLAVHGRAVALPGIHLPPHRRQVAVVPQEGALFPHLSVADNIEFGLPRRSPRAQRARRVAECLELVGLSGLGERMPHELSGGQQQRVALARALAPSRRGRRWCCSTSRSARSTPRCGWSYAATSATPCTRTARPRSSSPTTRARRCRWPTRWR